MFFLFMSCFFADILSLLYTIYGWIANIFFRRLMVWKKYWLYYVY